MRVAICIVLVSAFIALGDASAAPAVDTSASYPTSAMARNVAAAQDAIKPSTPPQQKRNPVVLASPHAQTDAFDRRLASLDPSHIVYEQSQSPAPATQASLLDLSDGRLFPRQEQPPRRQHARAPGDFLLMGFAALMLIAYQLRKKHRVLRPHPFSY